ncbi:MAG: radical SAM protein [Pseudomonadota bacterium]
MKGSIADNLNFYAYLSLKLIGDDLYPHAYQRGRTIRLSTIKKKWELAAAEFESGKGSDKLGFYVHFPYCDTKCFFCYCDSVACDDPDEICAYVGLLKKELDCFADAFEGTRMTSLYFGGGTPALLGPRGLDDLFRAVYARYRFSVMAPVIFEGTAATLTEETVKVLVDRKVTRLTIGLQTLDERVMRAYNRGRQNRDFVRVFERTKTLGIPFVNIDLIAGLEGQSVASFMKDVKLVVDIGADMVHVNAFSPLAHTPFSRAGKKMSAGAMKNRDLMVVKGREYLAARGYSPTLHDEMAKSDDAVNTQEADLRQKNSSMLGIGYGAESHAFGHLWYRHPRCIPAAPFDTAKIPPSTGVKSSAKDELVHFMVRNLRSGFRRSTFRAIAGKDVLQVFGGQLKELEAMGRVEITRERVNTSMRNYKEFVMLSKHFYSAAAIRDICKSLDDAFDPDEDYSGKLDTYFSAMD